MCESDVGTLKNSLMDQIKTTGFGKTGKGSNESKQPFLTYPFFKITFLVFCHFL